MAIIEGIGDEIILFLAITFITAVVICIFIFPLQHISQNVTLPVNQDLALPHPSSNFAEPINATVDDSSSAQPIEIRNENTSDSENRYASVPITEANDAGEATDSVQDLISPDHSDAQTEVPSINDSEFLRKRRLEFFCEQLPSQNSEIINNGLTNNFEENGESAAIFTSQHNETASPSSDIAEHSTSAIFHAISSNNIRIRLKYLNDTERLVHSKLDDKIGDFKRTHFLEDITNNKIIRLIYNGQLLHGEERTLESFGIVNNSVIHVQISQNHQLQGSTTADDSDLDLSHLMWPLFGIILGVLWMLHFQYREYFNIASTVALVGITGLFLTAVWSQSNFNRGPTLRTGDNQQPRN